MLCMMRSVVCQVNGQCLSCQEGSPVTVIQSPSSLDYNAEVLCLVSREEVVDGSLAGNLRSILKSVLGAVSTEGWQMG